MKYVDMTLREVLAACGLGTEPGYGQPTVDQVAQEVEAWMVAHYIMLRDLDNSQPGHDWQSWA
jgi:hypothetical protein